MEKIVISSSAKFRNEIESWKNYFVNKGYDVINYPKKINALNIEEYKVAHSNFYKSLAETDILFALNQDKDGIEGYIGPAVFSEISFMVAQNIINNDNKKVYLMKMPSEDVACYAEINNFIKLGWVEIFDTEAELK